MAEKRNNSIDFVKGILILSVVIGHILLGSTEDNIIRYLIYSIHMPLFIGISGYLFRLEKMKEMSLGDLIKKYFFRVGIPWIIAVNVYFFFSNFELLKNMDKMGVRNVLETYANGYVKPYLHLWYVPAFLIYVFLTWLIIKAAGRCWKDKKDICTVLGVFAGIISIISFYNRIPSIKLYYFIFFALGMIIKELYCELETKKNIFYKRMITYSILFLTIRIILFFTDFKIAHQVSLYYYILNIPLLALLISGCEICVFPKCNLIEFMGRESLTIYLWHMFGRSVVVAITGREDQVSYYILNVLVFAVEIALIYYGKRIRFVDKYLFGNQGSHVRVKV